MPKVSSSKSEVLKYKVHWHVLFTHFPVSFFMLSFGFMVLHLITRSHCYELAASISLFSGMLILFPTITSGWLTWKGRYKGLPGKVFLYKIKIAIAMFILSFLLVVVRFFLPENLHLLWMWLYPGGIFLLMLGSMAEGYYGGRLNHR